MCTKEPQVIRGCVLLGAQVSNLANKQADCTTDTYDRRYTTGLGLLATVARSICTESLSKATV